MYKAANNLLPINIKNFFKGRDGGYQLRGSNNFKVIKIRTNRKRFCISFSGVKIWNGMCEELKQCSNIKHLKIKYKEHVFTRYRDENGCVKSQ